MVRSVTANSFEKVLKSGLTGLTRLTVLTCLIGLTGLTGVTGAETYEWPDPILEMLALGHSVTGRQLPKLTGLKC